MSDIMAEAETLLNRSLSFEEWWDLSRDMWPDLVTEIERLREQEKMSFNFYASAIKFQHRNHQLIADTALEWIDKAERLEEQLAVKDALCNDLLTNCNQLRDRCWKAEGELDRWQKIAIDERAEVIRVRRHNTPAETNWRSEAAKELNHLTIAHMIDNKKADERLKVLLAYVGRLEKEYLKLKERDIRDNGPFYHVTTATGRTTPLNLTKRIEMAQVSLDTIKKERVT